MNKTFLVLPIIVLFAVGFIAPAKHIKTHLQSVIEETRETLGPEADLSYLTQELLEESDRANPKTVEGTGWLKEGNTIKVEGGVTKWRDGCSTDEKDWWQYRGTVKQDRTVNCANNLLKYKITAQ